MPEAELNFIQTLLEAAIETGLTSQMRGACISFSQLDEIR